jgi:oxygen-dependent protoporphyrinogen oxidase
MKQYAVIGGGIAGLASAYYLYQHAHEQAIPIQVTVYERDSTWGGKIRTDRIDGFVIEGGPDTFLATKPWAVALCRELGLENRLMGTNPDQKNTYVLHDNQLKSLPDGLTMMIPTQFGPMIRTGMLTWPEKARMGLDFVIPPRDSQQDESLGQFVSRRLGRAAYENLIEPLMSGIYAGDGDQLSVRATFPYLHELEREHGGLVKGALAVRRQRANARRNGAGSVKTRPGGSRSVFLTPRTGLAEIIEALVARLQSYGAVLHLNRKVQRVTPGTLQAEVILSDAARQVFDGVIIAAPAPAAAQLLADTDRELSASLAQIPYVSTATVSLAYHQADLPRPLDGYGYVIPRRAGRRALACTWTSTKFPHRAPQDMALLRVFIGRAGQEAEIPWDEAGLLEIARAELAATLGLQADPLLTRIYRWEAAMPQYNLGHPQRLAAIEARLAHLPSIALAGNGYRGIGIPDCIHSGDLAAARLLEREQKRSPESSHPASAIATPVPTRISATDVRVPTAQE